jgi:hypothetical protein
MALFSNVARHGVALSPLLHLSREICREHSRRGSRQGRVSLRPDGASGLQVFPCRDPRAPGRLLFFWSRRSPPVIPYPARASEPHPRRNLCPNPCRSSLPLRQGSGCRRQPALCRSVITCDGSASHLRRGTRLRRAPIGASLAFFVQDYAKEACATFGAIKRTRSRVAVKKAVKCRNGA